MLEWKLLFARVVSAPPAVLTDTSAHPDLSSVVRLFLVSTFKQTLHPYRPFSLPRWLFSVCLCDFRKRWFHRGRCEISEKPPAECIYYPVWTPPCLQILNGSVNMSWHINSKYMKPFRWHIFRNIVCQIPCVCRTCNEIGASHPERDIQGRSWLCEYGLCPQKDAMQGLNLVNKRLCDSAPGLSQGGSGHSLPEHHTDRIHPRALQPAHRCHGSLLSLRLNLPPSASWDWTLSRVAVQTLQEYLALKRFVKPANERGCEIIRHHTRLCPELPYQWAQWISCTDTCSGSGHTVQEKTTGYIFLNKGSPSPGWM